MFFKLLTYSKKIIIFLSIITLCACSFSSSKNEDQATYQATNFTHRPMFIQNYVDALSDSLIVNSQKSFKQGRTAVGSIALISSLNIDNDLTHPLFMLGNQIQESLMTSLSQKGYKVVEYRRAKNLIIHNNYDKMLTRELDKLIETDEFNSFVTGTIKYQENGAVVNLRVVELSNNQVIAATTKFIPLDVFWDRRQVNSINGMPYRNSYRESQ